MFVVHRSHTRYPATRAVLLRLELELREVNARVGDLVDFLERFMHDELDKPLLAYVSAVAAKQLQQLAGISRRLRERRLQEWRARIKRYRRIAKKQLARLAGKHRYDVPSPELHECPLCHGESVVLVEFDIGICTLWDCRELFMLEPCEHCGSTTFSGNGCCKNCDATFSTR